MKTFIWEEWSERHVGGPVMPSYTVRENFGDIVETSPEVQVKTLTLETEEGTTCYSSPQSDGWEETWTETSEHVTVVSVQNGSWIKVPDGTYRYLMGKWYYEENNSIIMRRLQYPPAEYCEENK